LGIQGRPDGKKLDDFKYLHDWVVAGSDGLRTGHFRKEAAWLCINFTISMKTIEHPLLATTFTHHEVHQFMKPLLRIVALNSFNVEKDLPRKLVYGTLRSLGLGIQDPFCTQLIQHLQVILRRALRKTPTRMVFGPIICWI
jgi:hypothetical protein